MTVRLSWGWGVALAYTLFAATTIGTVAFAVAHPVDLVSADYYAQASDYDSRLAAINRADALGVEGELRVTVEQGLLRLALPSARARSMTGTVTLYRPSGARWDRTWPLAVDDAGAASFALSGVASGAWRLRVEWVVDGRSYYREQALRLP